LMSTVRAGPPQFQLVDLGALLHESVELFVKGLPPSGRCISVQTEILTAPPPVRADAGRIMQVLIDLLTNAHQAIVSTRQQGHIQLRAEPVEQDGSCWVKVDVSDDGPGIPPDAQQRIFEPFFTTKGVGQGLGLGLEAVYRIVKNHHGDVTFKSVPGDTRFQVRLPIPGSNGAKQV